jgi:hypothetical protein
MTDASQYYARKRRRKKQDQKAFALAGIEPAPFRIITLAVNVGGGGYNVGDEFLIAGGTFSIQGRGYVVAEVGNVVTAVAIQIAGAYTVTPGAGAATVAQTGGGDNLLTVDVTLSALFDFGAAAAGGSSANTLTLPADIKIAFEPSVALAAGDFGIENVSDAVTSRSADAAGIGAVVNMNPLYRQEKQIKIARAAGSPSATVKVYFRGPKSQFIQMGVVTFT